MQVLIDTWWNVNFDRIMNMKSSIHVLIDTWWNVNYVSGNTALVRVISFNRYMVECECCQSDCIRLSTNCFNRYMVECE